jgi:acylphosphatase
MLIHADIIFIKNSAEDGFAFACMKAAYFFGITGRMDYNHQVKIEAEGHHDKMQEFISWIKDNVKDTEQLLFNNSLIYSGKFKEFDIFRHNNL